MQIPINGQFTIKYGDLLIYDEVHTAEKIIEEPPLSPTYHYYLSKAQKVYEKLLVDSPQLEPRYYQPEMAALYALRANNICAGSCGLGKTLVVGLLISIIYPELIKPGQIQIAAPNNLSAKSRWFVDLQKLEAFKDKVEVITSEQQALNSNKPIWIYTIDFIKRKVKSLKGNSAVMRKLLVRRGLRPSLLVIDEIHLLKPNSERSKHWQAYRQYCKRFLGLSGTLSDGRLDLYHHLISLAYGGLLSSRTDFLSSFGTSKKITTNYLRGEEQITGVTTRYLPHLCVTKLREFSDISQRLIHRVSLNDPSIAKCVTIPSHHEHNIQVLPHPNHRELYLDYIDKHRRQLEQLKSSENLTLALNVLTPLMRLSATPPDDIQNNKLERLKQIVSDTNGKTAIFGNLIDTCRTLHSELSKKYKEQVIRLYATDSEATPKTLSNQAREDLLSQFLYDDKVRIGIFSINLAAESIDLNSASQVIFYDYPWQSIKLQQALHRVVRPGSQVKEVGVYYLVNQGMIDQHQHNLLKERSVGTKIMLDFDPSDLSPIDLSVMNIGDLVNRTLDQEVLTLLSAKLQPVISSFNNEAF